MKNKAEKSKKPFSMAGRRFRHGGYATLLSLLIVAIVVVVNIMAGAVERNWALNIDLTANKITSLSEQTTEIVKAIDQPVHIYTTFAAGATTPLSIQVDETLNRYRVMNKNIQVENVDPDVNPTRMNKFLGSLTKIDRGSLIIANGDETQFRVVPQSALYDYGQDRQGQTYRSGYAIERNVTSALMYVTSKDTPNIYFLSGHGEVPYSQAQMLTSLLTNENYEPSELALAGEGAGTLKRGDVVVVLAPTRDLADDEREVLKNWLIDGGRMLVGNAPNLGSHFDEMPNFKSLLELYDVGYEDGIILEDQASSSAWLMHPLNILPTIQEHDVTKTLLENNARLMTAYTMPIRTAEMPTSGIKVSPILTTSDKSYLKGADSENAAKEPGDKEGPFDIGVLVEQANYEDAARSVRVAMLGSVEFILSSSSYQQTNSIDFIAAVMEWLVGRQTSVYIRSKAINNTSLQIPDIQSLYIVAVLVVVVVPLIVLVLGIITWIRRRHL